MALEFTYLASSLLARGADRLTRDLMESEDLNPTRLPPGTRLGPWRVLEQCGRGTYGVVYRAVPADELAADAVALKLALHPRDARFAREAELLCRIRHPAVPRLIDHGHWQPRQGVSFAWLVMDWVEGLPLYEWAQAQCPSSRQVLHRGEEPRPAGRIPIPQRVTVRRPPRMRRWPWFAAAGLGGALALSVGGLLSVSRSEEPETAHVAEQEEARDAGTVAVGDSALTAPVEPERALSVWTSIAVDVPPKPFPGQRRPDGKGRCPGKVQVAINDGCWTKLPMDVKDCDDWGGVEYRGACYQPVMTRPRPATSGPAARDDSP
jgi:hypothetical protein